MRQVAPYERPRLTPAAGRGENVAPAETPQVERREAPHPYVTGVRRPRSSARRTLARVRQGCLARHPGASRHSISLACKGEGKMGRATPGARKSKSCRAAARCLDLGF